MVLAVTTIQMSVARERKRIMLIRSAGRVRNMKNFRLARRLPLVKELLEVSKKTWRIHVCIFDGSDDTCDS